MGFRLNLKSAFPIHSHLLPNAPIRLSSSPPSARGKETMFSSGRLSFQSSITEEGETQPKDSSRAYNSSSASSPALENDLLDMGNMKVIINKRQSNVMNNDVDECISWEANSCESNANLQSVKTSHFNMLMDNLTALEDTLADSDVLNLEKDILLQLGRLGALKLFHTCLSKALVTPETFEVSDLPTKCVVDKEISGETNNQIKITVRSGKSEVRKSICERRSAKLKRSSISASPSTANQKRPPTSAKRAATKRRRLRIAWNEAEMSRGVKVVANLERIRSTLEEESGQVASLSCWAEAAGVDERVLLQNLHFGWLCRDEILRSTRSLVLFLTRNYRGLGIALDDLVQAGNMGVLDGAERFDHTRGYKFSTYVQYWIRKSMSRMVAWHARGIRIPLTLSTAIYKIEKARKSLSKRYMKYPNNEEIAKVTGLSVAKVGSAGKCLRVVGSIDQKMGSCIQAKFMEFTPDLSIESPEEVVLRQNMRSEIYALLNGLDIKERRVLISRYGLKDNRFKSLEEIGRHFKVSKEWIRRVERKALKKLRDPEICKSLSHYRNL